MITSDSSMENSIFVKPSILVFLLVVTAIFAVFIDKEDGIRNGHSLINITSVNTRSIEVCCNEENLLHCTEITVDPVILLSGEGINILGSDLLFDSIVEPLLRHVLLHSGF